MKSTLCVWVLLLGACSTEPSPAGVSLGRRGGANVELEVSADGATARFKFGALGTIDEPFVIDDAGRFDLSGTCNPKLALDAPFEKGKKAPAPRARGAGTKIFRS